MSTKDQKIPDETAEVKAGVAKKAEKQMNQPEDAAAFESRMNEEIPVREEKVMDAPAPIPPEDELKPHEQVIIDEVQEKLDNAEERLIALEEASPAAPAQSIDVPRVEGMNKIHGLEDALNAPLEGANFTYHIFAQVIQPGTIGMICGLYAFPFRITTTDTYMQARLLVANQNNVEVGKLMFVNFVLLDG